MSENIQSISQGTFTIGSTSATSFEAGPGISITQPSEGTVRIANDETVLWSGNGTDTSSFSLSEPVTNFDRVLFLGTHNQGYWSYQQITSDLSLTALRIAACHMTLDSDGAPLQMWGASYSSNNGLDYSKVRSEFRWFNFNEMAFGGNTGAYPKIYKIIGINRKANA